MRVLEGIKPEKVFYYFEEICKIPHGSGNIQKISDYLVSFARKRGLEHYQDTLGNVIMIKEASEGYEDAEPVMLQGHMDMVAVKRPGCMLDLEKDGLKLKVDGDRIYAKDTSLGGDDGIAVAYGLAIMDGDAIKHPRLELVLTVDEETGMDGAREIDLSVCRAHTLLNLDSEEEGIFLAGCAGGARVNFKKEYQTKEENGILCRIKVSGLMGGHSGAEIHKERGNANKLLARVLNSMESSVRYHLVSWDGGLADNAIPREAMAILFIAKDTKQDDDIQEKLPDLAEEMERQLKDELAEKDAKVKVEVEFVKETISSVLSRDETKRLVSFIHALPNGVQAMSGAIEGLVETSLNLGIFKYEAGKLNIGVSVRSSLESAKRELIATLQSLAYLADIEVSVSGDYPGWVYRKESPLREKMIAVYEEMFDRKPETMAIHAGLECGLLACKIENLDCVSIGPDMKNIHTTEEELSISSTERVYRFVLKLLEEMK